MEQRPARDRKGAGSSIGTVVPPKVWPKEVAEDQRTIRNVELVAGENASLAVLGELEIPVDQAAEKTSMLRSW